MERRSGRNWRFIAGVGVLSSILIGLVAYTVVPSLLTYEQLEFGLFCGFTSNSESQIRQATFILANNGTRALTISTFWINATPLNPAELRWDGAQTIFPVGSTGPQDTDVCLTPDTFAFSLGSSYNFTVGTASEKRYSYIVQCDEASVNPENLTIDSWDFVPGFGSDWPEYIGFRYRNNGKTPIIVTNVTLNGQPANTNLPLPQWTWPGFPPGRRGPLDSIIIYCNWNAGQTYLIRIETVAGNEYQLKLTAPAE